MSDSNLHWVVFAALAVLVLWALAGSFVLTSGPVTGADAPELVEPVPNGSSLWPYTSRTRSFATRTLGINLIVRGDPVEVRQYLLRHVANDWRQRAHSDVAADMDQGALPPVEPGIAWRPAHGGARYTYVERSGGSGDGEWIDASYQLYEGTYLGTRYHVRAYTAPVPDEPWTAMQAHTEYWDWFGLRHTVISAEAAQQHMASDLEDDPAVRSVRPLHLENPDTADGDGWATLIEFAALALALGLAGSAGGPPTTHRDRLRALGQSVRGSRALKPGLLVAAIGVVTLGVRASGIALELTLPTVSPVLIAGGLYPVLAVGLPLTVEYFARPLRMQRAFLLTVVAFAAALWLDGWYLGLTVVPVGLALHRVTLLLSLGLIAAAAAYRARGGPRWNVLRQIGLVGWVFALVLPVVGLV